MSALICGSFAYDNIMVFQDHFKNHILPDKIHILNVSFLVPELRREFGGCAGNIAYNLKMIGGDPLPGSGAKVLEKDSWSAAVVDELKQKPQDIKVDKHRMSGFWGTQLDPILRNMGVTCLLFAGVNTDVCVMTTLQDAQFNGYGCVMIEDCCGTTSPTFCTEAAVWQVENIYGFVLGSRNILSALKTV